MGFARCTIEFEVFYDELNVNNLLQQLDASLLKIYHAFTIAHREGKSQLEDKYSFWQNSWIPLLIVDTSQSLLPLETYISGRFTGMKDTPKHSWPAATIHDLEIKLLHMWGSRKLYCNVNTSSIVPIFREWLRHYKLFVPILTMTSKIYAHSTYINVSLLSTAFSYFSDVINADSGEWEIKDERGSRIADLNAELLAADLLQLISAVKSPKVQWSISGEDHSPSRAGGLLTAMTRVFGPPVHASGRLK